MTRAIELLEVGARDGLQNEKSLVSTADKLLLISHAIDAGVRRMEVASFVNPKRVPQMADADEVCAGLPEREDVTYIGLVMNVRGAERAIATGKIDELGAVAIATDGFAIANQGQTSAQSVDAAMDIIAMARSGGLSGQVTIGAAFGCPFDGEVSEDHVLAMALRLASVNPREIAIADTIGVGDPAQVKRLVTRIGEAIAPIPVRAHFHNTRGTGLANVWAAIEAGARTVDTSLGGLGGCPFAPGAAGNVASEDVVYMLERAGISTGIDLPRVIAGSHWLEGVMGRTLPAMVSRAPHFPKSE
jgi:hydroxymethylglutaryl-CoA lyase